MAKFFIALFFVFFLASCGGGGGGNPPTTETPTTVTMAMMDDDDTGDGNDSPTPPRPFDSSYYLTETGARFAHDAGYTGEGVTVYIDERLRHTHSAISANIISLTGECRIGLHNPFCNAFEIEPDNLERKSHGTGVAGILVNTAPDIRLVNPVDAIENAANYDVQIANHSQGIAWPDGLHITSSLAMITMNPTIIEFANRYAYAKDADIVWVDSNGNEGFNTLRGNPNAPAFFGALPYIVDGLEDNWLMVGSITTLTTTFDNGCGYAAMWCIMAFGETLSTANSGSDTEERHDFGRTSGATPQVAGALAVLKSAADDLHSGTEMTLMTNVRLILLETATPLYADASKNGVRMTNAAGNPVLSSVYGWGLVNISAGISHLQGIAGQMQAIENSQIPRLGGAAAAANGGKFAAAAGESAFRFWGGLETESVYGGLATKEYGGISAFGEVGNSALEINSFLANGEVQNAESESWTAGIQRGNIWRHNDNLQISARQESRLNDGELVLQYSFGKQIRIPIKQKPTTIWTAAYSQESDNGKWTAAMEWNALTDAKGFSFAAEIDL